MSDFRYALRMWLRTPAFTAVAVLALAIGIGANTAIFTVINAALLERLPFKDPQRFVAVWEVSSRRPSRMNSVGPANYLRWRDRAKSFEDLAGVVDTRANLTGAGAPEELIVQQVTDGFFRVLAVQPVVGRTFSAAESADSNGGTVVLAYSFWRRRFGGDPSIVGRSIELNGAPTTVVGVMPPNVNLTLRNSLTARSADLWRPWVLPTSAREPRGRFMGVVARLAPDVTLARAQAEMRALAAATAVEMPEFDAGWSAAVVPIREELAGDLRPALSMLAGAVAFVLLIACANVANLLLSRAAIRRQEIAIRAALGASQGRVVRQMLIESFELAIAGGGCGLLIAQWGLDAILAVSPIDLAKIGPVRLSYTVLAFTGVVSVVTAILSGIAPAFEGSRTDVRGTLKDGSRLLGGGSARLRQTLVVAEIALAVALVVGAGLMMRSFAALRAVPVGLDTHDVLTMRVSLPPRKYDGAKALRFFADTTARVASIRGVQAAGAISFLPFAGLGAATDFTIVGRPAPQAGQSHDVTVSVCDNGYFQVMHLPLVRGRWFTEREQRDKSNVVIINAEMVRRYFPNEDPIGRQLVIDMLDRNGPTEIVGVVGDAVFMDLRGTPAPQSYWPHPQLPYAAMTLTVRTAGDPLALAPAVEHEIQALDKDQPVSDVRTMDQWLARSLSQDRFTSLLLATFAAVATLLAAIGIYGVMSHMVSQRTPEIGIRLALGADGRDVLAIVLGGAAKVTAIGLAAGVALALALTRTIATLLFGTTPTDPTTFAAVVGLLAVIALVATYLPARRATRISPTEALRYH